VNEDEWKDLTGDDEHELAGLQPVFKVVYGPAGVVHADLARAKHQMNIMAQMSKRLGDPRLN
jgi:hypothetical protein